MVAAAAAAERPTVAQVTQGLTCQCGCGLTVANCNHPQCGFSVPVRAEVQAMIDRGMGHQQIIAFYRHKFGEKVLSAPTAEGFNLLAWVMPFAAIGLGGGLIALLLGKWRAVRRAAGPESSPQAGAAAFDPALRRRLEDELKENV